MILYFTTLLLGALLIPALALPSSPQAKHTIHEKRDDLHRRWIPNNGLSPDHIIPARIGLTQSNLDLGPHYLDKM
jgi:tripeptidyl-peptidase I